jgi:endonuclease III
MRRLAVRLGLVNNNTSYEKIQKALANFLGFYRIPKASQNRFARLLWLFAKYTCSAKKPQCQNCLLETFCKKILTEKLSF